MNHNIYADGSRDLISVLFQEIILMGIKVNYRCISISASYTHDANKRESLETSLFLFFPFTPSSFPVPGYPVALQ